MVVSNITVKDSPFWSVRFWASQQVRATNLTITATRHVFNNDGIDVDSSSDAVIENLYYDVLLLAIFACDRMFSCFLRDCL